MVIIAQYGVFAASDVVGMNFALLETASYVIMPGIVPVGPPTRKVALSNVPAFMASLNVAVIAVVTGTVVPPMAGIVEITAGTGGADHTSIATIAANSLVRNTNTFGILMLTLHDTSYDWQFVPEAGKSFTDSGTGYCH